MSRGRLAPAREDIATVWDRVADLLGARLGERNFSAWIAPLRCRWTAAGLALEAPNPICRDWVARHFARAIEDAAAQVLGSPCPVELRAATVPPAAPFRGVRPSPTHAFETFVIGETNALAYAAARTLADEDTRAPLFLHGPSGVGKTHLLHAVFHALEARGVTVTCLPAARLVSALVTAYETHTTRSLWEAMAPLDGLLLDDVHCLAGQDEVQERLTAGLVAWQEQGRLLVLTSDRAPGDLPVLAERVRASFAGGIVAGIAAPEPALRLAILERKAAALGLPLEGRLAARLAAELGGNVRRLEGALTRLVAHSRFFGRRLDEALAVEILPELRAPRVPPATLERILDETAAAFHTTARALRGRSRRRETVLARQVAMHLARRLLRRPFAEIAAAFGRDHTTVLHASRRVSARLASDGALATAVERIEGRLTTGPR